MGRTFENYALLISRALMFLPPTSPIFVHSYDYAVPDGRGVFGGAGWLKPALDGARVPQKLPQACISILIDAFHSVLERLARESNYWIVVVDTRGVMLAGIGRTNCTPTQADSGSWPTRGGRRRCGAQV